MCSFLTITGEAHTARNRNGWSVLPFEIACAEGPSALRILLWLERA